ncbi:MAG: hypothetical protein RLZZ81_227 [Pseudomonadota bacterium]|jgi:hypothetical protein
MSKASYTIDLIDTSIDTKLVTITAPGANTLNTIIINKSPFVIKAEDFEPTDKKGIFTLKSHLALSHGLNNMTLDYSEAGLFSGPAISYDDKLGSITFSEPVDSSVNYKVYNTETLGNNTAETENV